jgi:hypothetical protein
MCSGLGLARPFVLGAAPGSYGARACAVAVPGSRLSHSRAQASMANAKNRSESRSYRTRSRRHPASQAIERSAFQRWRPNRVDDSTPRRAIRTLMARRDR